MTAFPAHIRPDGTVQTCEQHCKNVATVSGAFLASVGLRDTGYLGGVLHDCGKFTDEFRTYIEKASRGEKVERGSVIHTFAAVRLLLEKFHDCSGPYEVVSELLACAVGGHHGLFDCFDEENKSGMEHRLKKQPEYDKKAIANFYENCMDENRVDALFESAATEIGRCAMRCKAISSGNDELYFYLSMLARLVTSAIVDADRQDTADFMNQKEENRGVEVGQCPWSSCLKTLYDHLDAMPQEQEIQRARRAFSDECDQRAELPTGIYKFNLPTGGGKTLSGLRFALKHAEIHQKKRIFFISPLLSILDQNAEVIRKAIGHGELILEHHSDVLTEGMSEEELGQYEYLTDTWNAPIVITTLVQFLYTLFSGKMASVRRFHSLAESVIVIDEVQTVPNKMLTLFNLAMNFLCSVCGATVVLCSATQPEFEQLDHPLKTNGELIPEHKTKQYAHVFKRNTLIPKGNYRSDQLPDLVLQLTENHRSVLVVCNKKDEAADLFHDLQDDNVKKYHLSAGMCMAHRKNVLADMRDDLLHHRKIVCIATQVIEAGVDVSFDAVIRLTAGLDNIVQAAGRCNRNGENGHDAPVWIVNCSDERLSQLKDIASAKNATVSLLDAYEHGPAQFENSLSSDRAVSFFYQKLYRNQPQAFFDFTVRGYPSLFSLLSGNEQYAGQEADKYLFRQAFKTAGQLFRVFDTEQKSVIVPYGEGERIIGELKHADISQLGYWLERAKPYVVNIFDYQYEKLYEQGGIIPLLDGHVLALNDRFYDMDTGVTKRKDGEGVSCNTLIW